MTYTQAIEALRSGFYGFWIRSSRVSYLLTGFLVIAGIFWITALPKENSPTIEFGTLIISTSYPGASPSDIDALITEKLYKEVKDIDGVKKITSTSSLGRSSIVIELDVNTKSDSAINDVRNAIGSVSLPEESESPVVSELKTDTGRVFSLVLAPREWLTVSTDALWERTRALQEKLEAIALVKSVDMAEWSTDSIGGGGNGKEGFDLWIVIDSERAQSAGLSLKTIADTIRASNRNAPIGNYEVSGKKYDFRIEAKSDSLEEILSLSLTSKNGQSLTLRDISSIERHYDDTTLRSVATTSGRFTSSKILTVYKTESAGIFAASDAVRAEVEAFMKEEVNSDYRIVYTNDAVKYIRDDYNGLAKDALITVVLVFINMYLLIGWRDALISTLLLPLAYFATFGLLYMGGYSLNFLTNFSLVLSFGIAIDTIIVIVQGAGAKSRVGYDPASAILLSIREYSQPLIAGVMVSIVAFLPMMALPGVIGKFLAYIPITIFWVLATGLVLALTLNSALYTALVKRGKTYITTGHGSNPEFLAEDERVILIAEREWKEAVSEENASFRQRSIEGVIHWYWNVLRKFLGSTFLRRLSIIIPIILVPISAIILWPRVGFELFPSGDNPLLTIRIDGSVGSVADLHHEKALPFIEAAMSGIVEIRSVEVVTSGNSVRMSTELTETNVRKELGQMDSFEIESLLLERLKPLVSQGYHIESQVAQNGPPAAKSIGVKLTAETSDQLSQLIASAKDIEAHLKTLPGTKNVSLSSQDTPGQFILHPKREVMDSLGLSPAQMISAITSEVGGAVIGSIEYRGLDVDMRIKSSRFLDELDPRSLADMSIDLGGKAWRVGDLVDIETSNAIASISSENGDITISVESDNQEGFVPTAIQSQLEEFTSQYRFPPGISIRRGGENTENQELVVWAVSAFLIAIVAMFMILVLQFNSFSQPIIILYSVLTAISGVLFGLWLTGNPMSMPFAIGFISFTGVAVNHAIILIDAINANIEKGMRDIEALVEAGSSRFEPMMLTTLCTGFGILPLALKDVFWAGLGWTVIFGLMFASVMTLFVVKGVYYEIYLKPKDPRGGIFKRLILTLKALFIAVKNRRSS